MNAVWVLAACSERSCGFMGVYEVAGVPPCDAEDCSAVFCEHCCSQHLGITVLDVLAQGYEMVTVSR